MLESKPSIFIHMDGGPRPPCLQKHGPRKLDMHGKYQGQPILWKNQRSQRGREPKSVNQVIRFVSVVCIIASFYYLLFASKLNNVVLTIEQMLLWPMFAPQPCFVTDISHHINDGFYYQK